MVDMARMGGSKHLRTYVAPRFWPISIKEAHWAIKPSPGPHPIKRAAPLGIIVRDYLGFAKTKNEVSKALKLGFVKVDGKVRRDYKFPVGVMDVIEIVPAQKYFRVVPDKVKYFKLIEITKEEASIKPLRIENKTTQKGGHIQLNLIDGSNVLIRVADPRNPAEDVYSTLSTVFVKIPERQIIDYVPFQEGNYAVVFGGKNVGFSGKIKEIKKGMKRYRSLVTIESENGELAQTSFDYVFVVGRDKPLIKLD